MTYILTCSKCRTQNQVSQNQDVSQVPACAQCQVALPWLHDGTDDSFEQDIQASVLVIVDFWASWCGPCRIMGPILDDVAKEMAGKVRIVKINVDEHPLTPGQFGVQGIPTLIMFKNGEVVDEIVGVVQKPMLIERVKHFHYLGSV